MKIETTLGAIILVAGAAFLLGCQHGYHRTKEKFFERTAEVLAKAESKEE